MEEDRPKTFIHPPTVFYIALIIGYILRLIFGGRLPIPRPFAEGAGGLLIIIAIGIAISAISAFAEGGETLKPDTPSRRLFTSGPYRYSRNPIYLAMMAFGVGFGVATANAWIILTTAIAGVLFHFLVIAPEERYLRQRFGDEYEVYRKSVRRWF